MHMYLTVALLSAGFAFATPVVAEDLMPQDSAIVLEVEAESVQPNIDKQFEELHKSILLDAVEAVFETNHALIALENDQPTDAVAAIKTAIGKLEITLKRKPALGLKPIHVVKRIHDLHIDPNLIQPKVNAARALLKEGKLQQAKALLAPLVSETVITVTSIPLGLYPESLKAIVPLIDAGKIEEAKGKLRILLSTLVVKEIIIPLPPLRAKALLLKAEKLAENESRTERENKLLTDTFQEARNQLQIAEWLGYGDKNSFAVTYEQIHLIEEKLVGGKGGRGWFDIIKENLKVIFNN